MDAGLLFLAILVIIALVAALARSHGRVRELRRAAKAARKKRFLS